MTPIGVAEFAMSPTAITAIFRSDDKISHQSKNRIPIYQLKSLQINSNNCFGCFQRDGSCVCDPGYRGDFCNEQIICFNGNLTSTGDSCLCNSGYVKFNDTVCMSPAAVVGGWTIANTWTVVGVLLSLLCLLLIGIIGWLIYAHHKKKRIHAIGPVEPEAIGGNSPNGLVDE